MKIFDFSYFIEPLEFEDKTPLQKIGKVCERIAAAGCGLYVLAGMIGGVIVLVVGAFIVLGKLRAMLVGTGIVMLLGVGLFFFRRRYQAWYGLFEIFSALALGAFSIAHSIRFNTATTFAEFLQSANSLPTLLGLLSSAYILARGLMNLDEARKQRTVKKEEVARAAADSAIQISN